MVSLTKKTFGGKATYTCDAAFMLIGQSVRVCEASGEWEGSKPECRGWVSLVFKSHMHVILCVTQLTCALLCLTRPTGLLISWGVALGTRLDTAATLATPVWDRLSEPAWQMASGRASHHSAIVRD